MATITKPENKTMAQQAQSQGEVAVFQPARLPYHTAIGDRFDVDKGQWKVLTDAIFPAAKTSDAIVLALSYCQHRKLDIMKRPVHIVPMYDSKRGEYVETVWPGISELRTTATRTGEYAGCDEAEFGPTVTREFKGRIQVWKNRTKTWEDSAKTVEFPEWCRITVYRVIKGVRCKFVGPKVLWLESYATIGKSEIPNDMWGDRSIGQLEKCAEAAALRRAFPEEIGNELTAEEMTGRAIDGTAEISIVAPSAKDDGPPRITKAEPQREIDAEAPADAQGEIESGAKRDAGPPAGSNAAAQQARDEEDRPGSEVSGDPVDDIENGEETGEESGEAFGDEPEEKTDEPEEPKVIEPYKLSSKGYTTATWADAYIPMMQTSVTLQAVYKWVDLNNELLGEIKTKNAPVSAKIKAATEAKMKALREAGAVQAPKTTTDAPKRDAGPPRAGATEKTAPAKATKAKGKQVEIPAHEPSDLKPDTIIKWADAICARIEDPDQLAMEWQTRIAPYFAKLDFPPDIDELQGVLRHHEKRMEP